MNITIQTPGFNAQQPLLDFTNEKVGKLNTFSDRILSAEVTLKLDKSVTQDNKVCEIRLSIPGKDLFASKQATSFEEAILKTAEAVKAQLLSWKEKSTHE